MRVALVIGTRPQIIKSAPIIKEAIRRGLGLDVVHTGQHYDYELSRVFFNELELPDPVLNLGVGSGSHGEQTGRMLVELEKAYRELGPDVVVVPGDTNSTLAGALAAVKMGVPVAHVESGARSFDRRMPEEVNRVVVDHLSDLLFAVSDNCVANLRREGIPDNQIRLVGDTMYESVVNHSEDIIKDGAVERYGLMRKRYAVLTIHRVENTDDAGRLAGIMEAVAGSGLEIIYPCHPRTRARLEATGLMVAMKVKAGAITSSPGLSSDRYAVCSAAVPLDTA